MEKKISQQSQDVNAVNQPHDERAERAVLGSMLLDYDFIDLCVSQLTEQDFYIELHQKLFTALKDYRVEYAYFETLDRTLLLNFLEKKCINIPEHEIEALVLEGISDTDILLAIFEILRQKRKEREIIQLARELQEKKDINIIFSHIYENLTNESRYISSKYANLDDLVDIHQDFICRNYLPIARDTLTMLSAHGGSGKTWLALNVAIHCALEGAKVLYWTKEDSAGYLKTRTNILIEHFYTGKRDMIRKNFYLWDSETAISRYHFFLFEKDNFDVLILDPLLSFFLDHFTNENDNGQARKFISMLINEAQKRRITTLLIHHHTKNKDAEFRARGASAFLDTSRIAYEIVPIPKDTDKKKKIPYDIHTQREIAIVKDNFGVSTIFGGFSKILTIKPKPNFPELIERDMMEEKQCEPNSSNNGSIVWKK